MIFIGIIIGILVIIITIVSFSNNEEKTNSMTKQQEKKRETSVPLSGKAKALQAKYGATSCTKANANITICTDVVGDISVL